MTWMKTTRKIGQGAEHVGRDPALGGEHVDLAADLLAGPDEVGQRVEQVGQLAADRLLDADGLDDPVDVADVEALGHALEGVDERIAELGLGHDPGELLGRAAPSASSHIIWIDRRNVWPADSDEAISVRASGNCSSNFRLRRGDAAVEVGHGRGTGWPAQRADAERDARSVMAATKAAERRRRPATTNSDELAGADREPGPLERA